MITRFLQMALLPTALLLLAACDPPQATPAEYLTEEIPPCTPVPGSPVDPCELDGPPLDMGMAQYVPELGDEPRSLRKMLDGSTSPPAWVPHLVVRGTYLPNTVRCTAGDPFRPPPYLQDESGFEVNPRAIKCYVDVRANAYIFSSGPSALTMLLFHHIYWDGEYALDAEEGQTEQDVIEEVRQRFEAAIGDVFSGREHLVFLGPAVDLSSEAWQVVGIWDVQRQEDATVIAVHPYRDLWRRIRPDDYQTHRSALEMELPAFTQAVTTAHQARMEEYGGRIGADATLPMLVSDANQLRQYYTEVGAYDDPDNPPAQPPVAPPPPRLALERLDGSVAKGGVEWFSVTARDLDPSKSYYVLLTTDNGGVSFRADSCAHTPPVTSRPPQQPAPPPSGVPCRGAAERGAW